MIYVVHGTDTFSTKEFIDELKTTVGPKDLQEANVTSINATNTNFSEIIGLCSFVPFLSERRLIIIEGLLTSSGGNQRKRNQSKDELRTSGKEASSQWEIFVSNLQTIPATTDVIFLEDEISNSNLLLKDLAKIAEVKESRPLNRNETQRWVQQRVALLGKNIESRALDLFTTLIGNDLWNATNEIEKLSLYCNEHTIRLIDVQTIVNPIAEANIFPAIDAAIQGDATKALTILRALISKGAPVSYPLGMLARQVRILLITKSMLTSKLDSGKIGNRLGINSTYVLQKTLALAETFSQIQLVSMHQVLLEADLAIKTSSMDDEMCLELAVAEISSARK